jgi:hypothetical protein
VEVGPTAPAQGMEPWNSQFEPTDRPNVCRLFCQ